MRFRSLGIVRLGRGYSSVAALKTSPDMSGNTRLPAFSAARASHHLEHALGKPLTGIDRGAKRRSGFGNLRYVLQPAVEKAFNGLPVIARVGYPGKQGRAVDRASVARFV